MADLVKVTIDGREAMVPKGALILDAARQVGVDIPVFCYHEKMNPVGACRMCLIEIEKVPRLQTACTTPVADGMVVKTDSPAVEKARKGVLEFLLTNHPLDCPICDKGGECPLQDTTFKYGCDKSRFSEEKLHFEKAIRLGPQIVLDRERCIMCTRCVRFHREIAGDEALTILERGVHSEIGVLPGRTDDSPFSGNTTELCPVGALTSAKFRFRARSWELKSTPSVCAVCSVGCNIRVETRADQVLRLMSRENPDVDDGWLCDWGRYSFDLVNDPARLSVPMIRRNGDLEPATWEEAVEAVATGFRQAVESWSEPVAGIISASYANEDLYLFQKLFRTVLKSNNLDYGLRGDYAPPAHGLDAATGAISALERARVIVLVGADPLTQQPVLDLRIKKAATKRGAKLVSISAVDTDLTRQSTLRLRPAEGAEAAVVNAIVHVLLSDVESGAAIRERLGARCDEVEMATSEFEPKRGQEMAGVPAELIRDVARLVAGTSKVAVLFPRGTSAGPGPLHDACERLALVAGCLDDPDGGLYPLGREGNCQGALDLGVLPNLLPGQRRIDPTALEHLEGVWGIRPPAEPGLSGAGIMDAAGRGKIAALYLVGLDPAATSEGEQALEDFRRNGFLVVQDLFLTPTAHMADVVLPGVSFAEKDGTLTNLERRVQRLHRAVALRGQAKPDWRILADVANALGAGWDYGDAAAVFSEIRRAVPGYGGLRFDDLAPRGQRWPAEEAAPVATASPNGHVRGLWYQPMAAVAEASTETGVE